MASPCSEIESTSGAESITSETTPAAPSLAQLKDMELGRVLDRRQQGRWSRGVRLSGQLALCFGFLLPLLPAIGRGAFLTVTWSYVALSFALLLWGTTSRAKTSGFTTTAIAMKRRNERSWAGMVLDFLPPGLWLLALSPMIFLAPQFDAPTLIAIAQVAGGPLDFIQRGALLPWTIKHQLLAVSYLILPFLLFRIWSSDTRLAHLVGSGSRSAVWLVVIVALGQFCLPSFLDHFAGDSKFWRAQNRIPATFSDPNAFGIGVLLLLPLVAQDKAPNRRMVLVLLLLLAGMLSGSRSLILGLVLALFAALWRRSKVAVAVLLLCTAIAIGLLNLAALSGWSPKFLPVTLHRAWETLVFTNSESAFFSRLVFWRANIFIIATRPITGIGLDRFRDVFPNIVTTLNLPVGRWIDNNNNFYLGIISELGLVGLVCLFFSIACFRLTQVSSKDDSPWHRPVLCAFALLLFLGPHLEFPEIGALVALLGVGQAEYVGWPKTRSWRWIFGLSVALGLVGAGFAAQIHDYGIYHHRRGAQTENYHFTNRRAKIHLGCGSDSQGWLYLRNRMPKAVSVRIAPVGGADSTETLVPPFGKEEVGIPIPCGTTASRVVVITVDRVWFPDLMMQGNRDKRTVGVEIRYHRGGFWE